MKFVTVYIARFNIISILLQKHSTMSLQQYNLLMSNLLNEKHTLAKLREKLERRRGKLCRSYKEKTTINNRFMNLHEGHCAETCCQLGCFLDHTSYLTKILYSLLPKQWSGNSK